MRYCCSLLFMTEVLHKRRLWPAAAIVHATYQYLFFSFLICHSSHVCVCVCVPLTAYRLCDYHLLLFHFCWSDWLAEWLRVFSFNLVTSSSSIFSTNWISNFACISSCALFRHSTLLERISHACTLDWNYSRIPQRNYTHLFKFDLISVAWDNWT